MAPIVTGDVNPAALEDLVRLCVELGTGTRACTGPARRGHRPGLGGAGAGDYRKGRGPAVRPGGGLAVFLAPPGHLLGVRLGGPSLPLDIGYSETIPAGIRNAVILRDKHCQWAGRCDQPASACEVHHTKHKANGGKTSVKDCVLLCPFHHQVVIHRWGWTCAEPGRHDHGVEQGQEQGPTQPQPTRPRRVTPGSCPASITGHV